VSDPTTPAAGSRVDGFASTAEPFKSNNKLRNKVLKNKKMDSKFIKKSGSQLTRAVLFGWNAFKEEFIK